MLLEVAKYVQIVLSSFLLILASAPVFLMHLTTISAHFRAYDANARISRHAMRMLASARISVHAMRCEYVVSEVICFCCLITIHWH